MDQSAPNNLENRVGLPQDLRFLRALQQDLERQRSAAEAYADENARVSFAMLKRHLADEEDLIVPLILDRGIGM